MKTIRPRLTEEQYQEYLTFKNMKTTKKEVTKSTRTIRYVYMFIIGMLVGINLTYAVESYLNRQALENAKILTELKQSTEKLELETIEEMKKIDALK